MPRSGSRSSGWRVVLVLAAIFAFLYLQRNSTTHPGTQRRAPEYKERLPEDYGSREAPRHQPSGRIPESCTILNVRCESRYFDAWVAPSPGACTVRLEDGLPVPDPHCTPGGVNPSVSLDVLDDPGWRTRCTRNCATSEAQKHIAYSWYGIVKPKHNSEENQVCELDHLVPLELGGADGPGNIWPQCGPDGVGLNSRYFKQKDRVENYLVHEVRSGRLQLADAQRGIATDWVQYLSAAEQYCQAGGRC